MVSSTTGLLLGLFGAGLATAQAATQAAGSLPVPTDIVGTWSSKSNSTLTGPGFYNPATEEFTEPDHTGISYSFSADGFYEEAYYRAVANPTKPQCPKGIIQWQHGSFSLLANGSLSLKPIAVDGRQLYSDPCSYKNSVYTRYNASEMLKQYDVVKDPVHLINRLTLYKHDGSPIMPLYLVMSPPEMLPTTTLNPLTTATPGGAKATSKVKRSELPMNHNAPTRRTAQQKQADRWWWVGIVLTASGGAMYCMT